MLAAKFYRELADHYLYVSPWYFTVNKCTRVDHSKSCDWVHSAQCSSQKPLELKLKVSTSITYRWLDPLLWFTEVISVQQIMDLTVCMLV